MYESSLTESNTVQKNNLVNETRRDRVALVALGCKTNQYEMDALAESLRALSFEIVEQDEDADIYVLNTCTVTAEAERKARQFLRRYRREYPDAILVACGCYAERSDLSSLADVVIGTAGRSALPALVCHAMRIKKEKSVTLETASQRSEDLVDRCSVVQPEKGMVFDAYEELGAVAVPKGARAFLKIQDGCDHRCTYCAIAPARGPARSRKLEAIIQEARELVSRGYRELNLTGTNINLYGIGSIDLKEDRSDFAAEGSCHKGAQVDFTVCNADCGEIRSCFMSSDTGFETKSTVSSSDLLRTCLPDVLEALEQINGLDRIRLGSLDAAILTPEMVKRLTSYSKLCPHFHLSLQSGSDRILRKMGRKSTKQSYVDVCQRLYKAFPSAGITTDLMVGFPEETEEDFQATIELCEKVRFLRMHVFPYSRRRETPAAEWSGQVARDVVKDRAARLRALAARLAHEAITARVGKERDVLVESLDSEGRLCGYTPEYLYVRGELDGTQSLFQDIGDVVRMRITGAQGKDALGIVVK